jgi:hypothetical protein
MGGAIGVFEADRHERGIFPSPYFTINNHLRDRVVSTLSLATQRLLLRVSRRV